MVKDQRRKLEIAVISDVHLGSYGCNADALLDYLKSIKPNILVLNGDIFDIWQFNKRYFPQSHMKVIKQITNMLSKNTTIYYITGNHDEMLRKFEDFTLGSLKIVNQLKLEIDGKQTWFFHGDVFDVIMQNSKWLMKLGALGYDSLILLNNFVNFSLKIIRQKPVRLSKKIKDNVKRAMKHIGDFETAAALQASRKDIDVVVCGHIHKPQSRYIETPKGVIHYLNSGDWIENLTALEYNHNEWKIFHYNEEEFIQTQCAEAEEQLDYLKIVEMNNKDIFRKMTTNFYEIQTN